MSVGCFKRRRGKKRKAADGEGSVLKSFVVWKDVGDGLKEGWMEGIGGRCEQKEWVEGEDIMTPRQ